MSYGSSRLNSKTYLQQTGLERNPSSPPHPSHQKDVKSERTCMATARRANIIAAITTTAALKEKLIYCTATTEDIGAVIETIPQLHCSSNLCCYQASSSLLIQSSFLPTSSP